MKINLIAVSAAFVLAFCLSPLVSAEEGVDRAVGGAKDTVTSPGKIVEGIADDAEAHGPVGVVTGTVKGTVNAAGQAVKGAADVGVGVLEAVTEPLRD